MVSDLNVLLSSRDFYDALTRIMVACGAGVGARFHSPCIMANVILVFHAPGVILHQTLCNHRVRRVLHMVRREQCELENHSPLVQPQSIFFCCCACRLFGAFSNLGITGFGFSIKYRSETYKHIFVGLRPRPSYLLNKVYMEARDCRASFGCFRSGSNHLIYTPHQIKICDISFRTEYLKITPSSFPSMSFMCTETYILRLPTRRPRSRSR